MGTHDPERRPHTPPPTTPQVPLAPGPLCPAPFPVTAIKRGEGVGSPVFAVPVLMGCSVGGRRAWGLEEKGQRLFLHAGGGSGPVFMMGKREETVSVSGLRERFGGW